MKKWMTSIVEAASVDAVSKSRVDVSNIGDACDYRRLYIYRYLDPTESEDALTSRIDGITAAVSPGDIVVYQYPCYNERRFEERFIQRMKQRGIHVVILIHDSEALRNGMDRAEVEMFNQADSLITHGPKMEERLRKLGVQTTMVSKLLFDYPLEGRHADVADTLERKLVFAGNLSKSIFLQEWSQATPLQAFGRIRQVQLSPKVEYMGEHQQEDLIKVLPKDSFGIAWDTNLDGGGAYQEYTRYNAPHKVSLYLTLGMPVIVWDQSAAADVVRKYNLGFAISSLAEVDQLMNSFTDEGLLKLKENVNRFSKVLRSGLFTRDALLEAEKQILLGQVEVNHEEYATV